MALGAYTSSLNKQPDASVLAERETRRQALKQRSRAMDSHISTLTKNANTYTGKNAPIRSQTAASMGADIAAPTAGNNRALNKQASDSSSSNILDALNSTTVRESEGFGNTDREQQINRMGDIENDRVYSAYQRRLEAQQRNAANAFPGDNSGSFNADGDFNGNGDSGLDADQLQNARLIASVGKQRGMGPEAIQIAIMTAMAESELRNISHGDRDSVGLFQQRTSQGWGTIQQIMDPNYSIGKFYDSLAGVNYGGMSPWAAAQAVQRSAFADGSNYQARYAAAQRAYNAIFNPNAGRQQQQSGQVTGSNGAANWINSNNNKYHDYDGAYGAQCVDLYAFYTTQFAGGRPNPVGYAPEIYNNYDSSVYNRLSANSRTAMGDVAVFGVGPQTPYGHVGIVVGDNGDGTLRLLQANATSLGSAGNTVISNISKASLYGYLRPRKLM